MNCSGLFWYICYTAKCLCQKSKSEKSFLNLEHWLSVKIPLSHEDLVAFLLFSSCTQNGQRNLYWLFSWIFIFFNGGKSGKEKRFFLFQKHSMIVWPKPHFAPLKSCLCILNDMGHWWPQWSIKMMYLRKIFESQMYQWQCATNLSVQWWCNLALSPINELQKHIWYLSLWGKINMVSPHISQEHLEEAIKRAI